MISIVKTPGQLLEAAHEEIDRLTTANKELKQLLWDYGRHQGGCATLMDGKECDCGWTDTLD